MEAKEKLALAVTQIEQETNFEIIAEIKAAMNSVYGEDKNQIIKPTVDSVLEEVKKSGINVSGFLERLSKSPEGSIHQQWNSYPFIFNYQAIIYFPEINITNGRDTHKITGIYVRFAIRPNGTIYPNIQGIRSTVTEPEYLSAYLHSHLHTLDYSRIRFTYFCTGVGEINQIMALLNIKYTSANLMMFLMHIKNYLEWESKEGTPYIYMENISRRRIGEVNRLYDHSIIKIGDRLINLILSTLGAEEVFNMFTFSLSEKEISVKSTPDLEKWLAKEILKFDSETLVSIGCRANDALCIKDLDGKYHNIPLEGSTLPPHDKRAILTFKGQEIKFQVINKLEQKKYETFANPKITEEVCKKFSRILTRTAITTPGIKSGNSLTYNTRASEPDNIPVQQDLDGRMVGDALL